MKYSIKAVSAITLGLALASAVQAGQTVQFLGTGPQITLQEATAMAGVDLTTDTNLSRRDIRNFSRIGQFGFTGCFPVPMVDPGSGIGIGTGIDCLRVTAADSTGAQLQALAFFIFSGTQGGTIVSLGITSVRPFFAGIGDAGGKVTHMTGSIPADDSGIVGGTGAFANATGSARVSGAVNLASGPFPEGGITLDCLWGLGADGIDFVISQKLARLQRSIDRIGIRLNLPPLRD